MLKNANRGIRAFLAAAFILLACGSATAESMEAPNNPVTFHGKLWARYLYVLEDLGPGDSTKDDNRFFVDRVYLTFDSRLDERIRGRARVEMRNLNDGDADIFLKTADLLVSGPFGLPNTQFRFGQTTGLVSDFLQGPWGYRVVSKTTTDRYLGVSTTYLGAGVSNRFADGLVETDLLVANRVPHNRNAGGDGAKYKTIGARVYVEPVREGFAKGVGVGAYAQHAPTRSPSAD
ncbi:MAG: porin, partial [Candidatus Eisenbacteria bacterium]|nr:porin [Candidatus Latescibacterota bacterium]MBD3302795.1 porin [Candidatus Eisenbacteria bacterium]